MAKGKRVTVSNTAVKIASAGSVVTLRNRDAANDVDLGDAGVTAGNGYRLVHGDTLATTIELHSGDLYAIRSGGADATIDVLIERKS